MMHHFRETIGYANNDTLSVVKTGHDGTAMKNSTVTDSVKSMQKRRLFITSCTRRKSPRAERIPAWERYEGGCFPLLKRLASSDRLPGDVDIVILSARYGLLAPSDPIEAYDQSMTVAIASALHPTVSREIHAILEQQWYCHTLILLEVTYMACFHGIHFPGLVYLDSFSEDNLAFLETWLRSSVLGAVQNEGMSQ